MGILNKILSKKVEVVNKNENAIELKDILIATKSISVGANGANVLVSNIISPSSLPIKNMTFKISVDATATIAGSTSVNSNPIENIFKSFSLKSNPSNKTFYDLNGVLNEMSLFERYLHLDGETNLSYNINLDNSSNTGATSISANGTFDYVSTISISGEDASKSGLALVLDLSTPADFFGNNSAVTSASYSVTIDIYASYEQHSFQEIELIKTTIPVNVLGIARIGYLLAQGKSVISQWVNYGSDANISYLNFSTNGGINYLYNKAPFSKLVVKEQIEYKNSVTQANFPLGQGHISGVCNLFTPMFETSSLSYIELNFTSLPNVNGYEVNQFNQVVTNPATSVSNEIIVYQIVLRE